MSGMNTRKEDSNEPTEILLLAGIAACNPLSMPPRDLFSSMQAVNTVVDHLHYTLKQAHESTRYTRYPTYRSGGRTNSWSTHYLAKSPS